MLNSAPNNKMEREVFRVYGNGGGWMIMPQPITIKYKLLGFWNSLAVFLLQ